MVKLRLTGMAVLLTALLAGSALAVVRTGPFKGKTAQRLAISFVVHRHTVTGVRYAVRYRCSDGRHYTGNELSDSTTYRIHYGHFGGRTQSASGATVSHIAGQLSGTHASGTVRRTLRIDTLTQQPDPGGNLICDSGKVAFTARLR